MGHRMLPIAFSPDRPPLPWQRGSVGGKCNWQHSMAHPRKPPIGAKILQKSLTQAEL